jgi:hypothetical protein
MEFRYSIFHKCLLNQSLRRYPIFKTLALCLLIWVSGGCSGVGFMPAEAALTLGRPTHVEAYRMGTLEDHPGYGGKMEGYAVIRTGSAPPELAGELAEAVQDPTIYRDEAGPQDFVPTVGYRFYRRLDRGRGQMTIDVLISFDSDQILMVARDNALREDFRRMIVSQPGRSRLLDLTRQAFPFDEVVQAIPELQATTEPASTP